MTVKRIVVDHRPQLIGFPIPGGIYLGPLIYYVLSFFYLGVSMNPFGLSVVGAVFGVLTTFLVYEVGKIIFENEMIGIFSVIIFGFSYLVNAYGRIFTGLTFAPIYALFTYLFIYIVVKSNGKNGFLPLGLTLILATHDEGTCLSLLLLALIAWYFYRFKILKRSFYKILALFTVSYVPLLIFDLRHNFFLVKSATNFFKGGAFDTSLSGFVSILNPLSIFPSTLSRIISISGSRDIASQILPCTDLVRERITSINPAVFLLAVFILGYFIVSQIFTRKRQLGATIILIHLLVLSFGIFIFHLIVPGYSYEWMLVIFFPAFAFIVAYTLFKILQKGTVGKILVSVLLFLFVFLNSYAIVSGSGRFGLWAKANAVKYAVFEIGDRPFYLESLGGCFAQGYIYLFWYFGQTPSKVEGVIYDQSAVKLRTEPPEVGVVLVNDSKNEQIEFSNRYNFYKSRSIKSKKIDDVEVLIIPAAAQFVEWN